MFDIIIEIAGLVAVLATWILLIAVYTRLPDVIPVHYNGLGQADAFGKKSEIFTLPVIATIVFAGMTVLSRFPHVFNYPVIITENNVSFQYGNMARMLRCLKLSLVLVFGSLVLQTVRNAEGNAEGLGVWFLPFVLAILIIPVLFFMIKSYMYR